MVLRDTLPKSAQSYNALVYKNQTVWTDFSFDTVNLSLTIETVVKNWSQLFPFFNYFKLKKFAINVCQIFGLTNIGIKFKYLGHKNHACYKAGNIFINYSMLFHSASKSIYIILHEISHAYVVSTTYWKEILALNEKTISFYNIVNSKCNRPFLPLEYYAICFQKKIINSLNANIINAITLNNFKALNEQELMEARKISELYNTY